MNLRRVLITGASSGIGAATARALGQAGVPLLLVARREDRLRSLAASLKNCAVISGDVRDEKFLSRLQALPEWSEVDVLINNAGLAKGVEKAAHAQFSDWQVMIDTNVTALMRLTHLVLPQMLKSQRGHIVNLGSVAGRWVYPGGAVYCASKFAVRAFSEGLRMDLLGTPIRVTNIEPGMVETEFSQVRFNDVEKAKSVYQGLRPLSAEDVAETIVWCLQRPAHVNIQELVLYPTDQAHVGLVHRRES